MRVAPVSLGFILLRCIREQRCRRQPRGEANYHARLLVHLLSVAVLLVGWARDGCCMWAAQITSWTVIFLNCDILSNVFAVAAIYDAEAGGTDLCTAAMVAVTALHEAVEAKGVSTLHVSIAIMGWLRWLGNAALLSRGFAAAVYLSCCKLMTPLIGIAYARVSYVSDCRSCSQ